MPVLECYGVPEITRSACASGRGRGASDSASGGWQTQGQHSVVASGRRGLRRLNGYEGRASSCPDPSSPCPIDYSYPTGASVRR